MSISLPSQRRAANCKRDAAEVPAAFAAHTKSGFCNALHS
jgi:hypothetical protein